MPTLPVHTNTAASAPHAWRDWLWSLLLHAAVLGFIHPVTGAALRFESALPADMAGLLVELRKDS